jgi:hypothetical protein
MSAGLHSREPLEVALALAELGVAVLPIHTPTADGGCTCRRASCGRDVGKHPRLRNGVRGATVDPNLIRGWLAHWPTTNIGAACGERLAVIDVDGPDEVEALHELCAGRRLGGLRVRTGRPGGWHIWFEHPGGELRTRVAASLVRAGATYVVVPPGLHANGSRYAFVDGELEPPPAWLVDELRRVDESPAPSTPPIVRAAVPADRTRALLEATGDDELEAIAAAPPSNHLAFGRRVLETAVARVATAEPGSRHSTVNKSAFIVGGYLAACGLDRDQVIAALTAAAEEAGLVSNADRAQTARTILRSLEAGAARPRVPERVT